MNRRVVHMRACDKKHTVNTLRRAWNREYMRAIELQVTAPSPPGLEVPLQAPTTTILMM